MSRNVSCARNHPLQVGNTAFLTILIEINFQKNNYTLNISIQNMERDLNQELGSSALEMQEAIEISQSQLSMANLDSNNLGVSVKNKNMATINTSIKNKNLKS